MEAGKQLIIYGSIALVLSIFLKKPILAILSVVVIVIGIIKTAGNHREDEK